MESLNLATLPKYLSNEAAAWELLESLLWPDGEVVCPHCGVIDPKHYFIASRSGERKTRTGQTSYRRLWKCRHCSKQFSVLVGTIFESSKIPVSKWLLAMWLFNAGKNGVSALELQRQLGIAYQSAWFMAHRLREAAKREPLASLWSGTVVSDETRVGGAPKNRHAHRRVGSKQGLTDKTPVVALVHKESGQVRTRVVTKVNGGV
jgi:transposase-like protein